MDETDFMQGPGRLSDRRALQVWTEYQRTGDPALRDRLVLEFAPMVKHVVYGAAGGLPVDCDIDELVSRGLETLIRSVDRYGPGSGLSLPQFCWQRVTAAVRDEAHAQPAAA